VELVAPCELLRGVQFWLALALFGVAASPSDAWWLMLGTLAMLGMFVGASIPVMEQRSLQRRPGYHEVIDRVPRFLPRPSRRRPGKAAV
jgi:steroid 5-alpha reductase family enzyme